MPAKQSDIGRYSKMDDFYTRQENEFYTFGKIPAKTALAGP